MNFNFNQFYNYAKNIDKILNIAQTLTKGQMNKKTENF